MVDSTTIPTCSGGQLFTNYDKCPCLTGSYQTPAQADRGCVRRGPDVNYLLGSEK